MSDAPPTVLFDSLRRGEFGASWRFAGHVATILAREAAQVPALLAEVERRVEEEGLYAAGYVAYEAANGLNAELPFLPGIDGLPFAWFALYRERRPAGADVQGEFPAPPPLVPSLAEADYVARVENIRALIALGESYQVNFTFPLTGELAGDPLPLYRAVVAGQRAAFGAFLDTGRFAVVSASPELFFSRRGDLVTTRPMKGTAPRGLWSAEDLRLALDLAASPKERAENLMIVDLLRNDLGIVSRIGSVTATDLFAVESYPTVHQMTSTVSGRLLPGTGLAEIFRALFPCGSVTGAPKRRCMEIIAATERRPRGVYCGAVGCLAPGGEATFSVAIRTLLLDRETGRLTLGVGSGITWDSCPDAEYAECLKKSAFLYGGSSEPFVLIETMGGENWSIPRRERHLDRMAASARYFAFSFDRQRAERLLDDALALDRLPRRLRLTLDESGELALTATPLELDDTPLRVALAGAVIDPEDRFRYHKTSRREILDWARMARPDVDEVIFTNSRGELTEGSYHTLVLDLDGRRLTPCLACGLLPGVMREELLEAGEIAEATLYPADLRRAENIWLVNSLRGWRRGNFDGGNVT